MNLDLKIHFDIHPGGANMTTLRPNMTVGEIVAQRPARSRVFERLGIEYCCGGKIPLEKACAKRGLHAESVIATLEATEAAPDGDGGPDLAALDLSGLVQHIEGTHHAYLRGELPRLGALTSKVARVHGGAHPWLVELDDVFHRMAAELEQHMHKEEQVLFPAIVRIGAGNPSDVSGPVAVMEHEHDEAGAALTRMRELSGGFTPPLDACNSFRAMLDGLRELELDTHEHISIENNILFPRALAMAG
jgi:regulator of cell morphogenesis and NO signaling